MIILFNLILASCSNINEKGKSGTVNQNGNSETTQDKKANILCEIDSTELVYNPNRDLLEYVKIKSSGGIETERKLVINKQFNDETDTLITLKILNSTFQYFKGNQNFLIKAEIKDSVFRIGEFKVGLSKQKILGILKNNVSFNCDSLRINDNETTSNILIRFTNEKITTIILEEYYD